MNLLLLVSAFAASATAAEPVRLEVRPEIPYVEDTGTAQALAFDLVVHNDTGAALRLDAIEVKAFDAGGAFVAFRQVGSNGTSPSIATIATRNVPAHDWALVFNPFFSWDRALPLDVLRYELTFGSDADPKLELKASLEVRPRPWVQPIALSVPVKARVLVWDGHDLYAHHRRWDYGHPKLREMKQAHNPSRYAYDLSVVDASGTLYKGTGEQPEDWLGFGATVVAPGDGTVVEAFASATDHGPDKLDWDKVPGKLKLLWGNYVLVDHGDGVVSGLFHLKQNSLKVKAGDRVTRGQAIAAMGFSGDAFTVHTHYQLQRGTAFDTDGLPSRFSGYKRVLGSRVVPVPVGSIDTGDVVEP